ncbi:MAG: disulfide bond formation protein B [Gammaproteobacteria bacterium]|nr:disulfide bond formation protein B [Gammaproteobacteria bacterium]
MKRLPYALIALACTALLGFGYYLQYVQHLEPCPLCMLQRLAFLGVGAVAVVAALHGPGAAAARAYAAAIALIALAGAGVAARQIWLQHLPPELVPECGPGLEFMLELYGWSDTLAKVLKGTGDCATVEWTFLGLSIAEWSCAWLALFATTGLALTLRRERPAGPVLFRR